MAAADGYIRIDTKINNKGAKAGLSDLSRSLKGFAAAVGVAFGVAAIVSFGRACIKAASDLAEVQNVVDVTFGAASQRINEFAKTAAEGYGLSELAAKQYTGTMGAMLKSMGIATDQATEMSIEMAKLAGDMASFYNLDTDEAFMKIRSGISGETEPLKQLGVNLNVANLEAYALAQGIRTSYNAMSQQNQAILRYNYLLDVTADAQGDFSRTSGSWANQVRVLALQWESFKASMGTGFIAVLTPVLQIINKVLGALNAAAVVFANFIAAVTGTQQKVVTGAAATADAVDGITEATEATGAAAAGAGAAAKEAQKQLQGFDELNVQNDTSASGGGGAGAGGAGAAITVATTEAQEAGAEATDPMREKMLEFFSRYQEEILRVKESWNELKLTVSDLWGQLVQQFKESDIGGAAFEALMNWAYMVIEQFNLIIGAFGKLLIAFNVPATIESALLALSSWFKAIGDAVDAVTPGILDFVDKALVPIAEWAGGKARDGLAFLAEQFDKIGAWFQEHKEDFTKLGNSLGEFAAALWLVLAPIGDAAWATAKAVIGGVVDALLALGDWALKHQETLTNLAVIAGSFAAAWWLVNAAITVWNIISAIAAGTTTALAVATGLFGAALAFVTSPIFLVTLAIGAIIAVVILCIKYWDEIKAATVAIWTSIAEFFTRLWASLKTAITAVWTGIAGFFSGIWGGIKTTLANAWAGIQAIWGAVAAWFRERVITPLTAAFDGFKTKFKGIWDSIGGIVRGTVNIIIDLINRLIRGVNKFKIDIPDWVSNIPLVSKYAGKSIGFNIPTIPRLAQGAVIPPNRQFAAILGDQRSGVNIETPLDTMLQAFRAALSEAGPAGNPNINITFSGELAAIGRVLAPTITVAQNAANRAAGRTLQTV